MIVPREILMDFGVTIMNGADFFEGWKNWMCHNVGVYIIYKKQKTNIFGEKH